MSWQGKELQGLLVSLGKQGIPSHVLKHWSLKVCITIHHRQVMFVCFQAAQILIQKNIICKAIFIYLTLSNQIRIKYFCFLELTEPPDHLLTRPRNVISDLSLCQKISCQYKILSHVMSYIEIQVKRLKVCESHQKIQKTS